MRRTPVIDHDTTEPPVFEPAKLLDGARRQKGLPETRCPAACLLDMDGEHVERLVTSGRAKQDPTWACFHTKLFRWDIGEGEVGVTPSPSRAARRPPRFVGTREPRASGLTAVRTG